MSSITSSIPAMLTYYTNQVNTLSAKTDASAEGAAATSSDSLEGLRRHAEEVVARSEGGLLRALNNNSGLTSSTKTSSDAAGSASTITLPDVAELDRNEANKLLGEVQTLIDQGLDKSVRFNGVNGNQQTQSLDTYQQWLQEKGGISVYA